MISVLVSPLAQLGCVYTTYPRHSGS